MPGGQNQAGPMLNLQNMMGGLGGMGGGMMQNVMDYTLRDLIMENYANQLEGMDEEFLMIFGNLRIGEVVTAFLGAFL